MPPMKIKPFNPADVDTSKISFSNVITIPEIGYKYCKLTYDSSTSNDKKLLVVVRGCKVKTFKKSENDKDGKDSKGKKQKYQMFMGVEDEDFINMVKKVEKYLITKGVENSKQWFDEAMEEEECIEMLKPTLPNHEKYGYSIGCALSPDFMCKSTTSDISDVSNLEDVLQKNTIIDVCISINKLKLGVGKYSLGFEINQINIKSIGNTTPYESNAINLETFNSSMIKLGALQQHEKGGKFCDLLYEDTKLRIKLSNIVGRIFKLENDNGVSYSLSIRLRDKLHTMVQDIDKSIFNTLLTNSKDYYGSKKTEKLLKNLLKPLESYNKADQEKIKKGEKPTYEPSIWLKIYHTNEKGFDGKIVNAETNKAITNTEDVLNKDINISSIEFYSRHIWFGPKGTSINLTVNKCSVSYDAPVYDMDDADEDIKTIVEKTKSVKIESETESDSEVENSDSD
jgi:hypothetical protein